MRAFLAFTLAGIVTGSIYAIAASGLVVTYSTSGVFNFAHGAIGMLGAFTFWQLGEWGWPAPVALLLVVGVLAPALGALIERGAVRSIGPGTGFAPLVVTLGLLVGLVGLAQALWEPRARTLPGFLAGRTAEVAGVVLTGHQLATLAVGVGVAAVLRLLLYGTRTGIAMRAMVDDRDLVALNGVSPARVAQLAWALGAALAALAGILLAPVLQLDVLVLTLLVVNAYAAAIVGRLASLPLTFAGAMALGLLQSYALGYLPTSGWLEGIRPSIPTLFLFAVLLLLPEGRLRGARRAAAQAPRVPGLGASVGAAAVFVAAVGLLTGALPTPDVSRLGQGLAFALIMLSLVPLTGYAGQISLCQMTFAGLGAFAFAESGGTPLGLLAAAGLAGLTGALVALPAVRLRGLYLALATMAFAVLADNIVFPSPAVFGLFGGGVSVPRLRLGALSLESERAHVLVLAVVFALFAVGVLALRRGAAGRLLLAMRDSPAAVATLGLDTTVLRLGVFSLSAAMAGVGGALFAALRTTAGAADFLMLQSLPILLLAVVGGITTVSGVATGGILLALLPVLQDRLPAVGGALLVATGVAAMTLGRNPHGVAPLVARAARALAGRPGAASLRARTASA